MVYPYMLLGAALSFLFAQGQNTHDCGLNITSTVSI
jgi:hypothetical protein